MFRNNILKCQCSLTVFSSRAKSSTSGEKEQFIQRSKIPSMHFQKSLPRLPIPELAKTCSRYLCAQEPIISQEDFKVVTKIVKDFEKDDGPQLQKELCHRDSMNRHTSYISAPWFHMYLSDRRPLPLNSNPGLAIVNDPKVAYNDQLIRASNLLVSTLKFFRSLRANVLAPEVYHLNPKKSDTELFRTVTGLLPPSLSWYGAYLFKAFPLDMSQYKNLFNTNRIPKKGKDELFYDESQRHIMVMKGGNFYSLDVLDKSGSIISSKTLLTCLHYILNDSKHRSEYPLGVLTTMERDKWADARTHLERIGNDSLLKAIDGSIFMLVLDSETPEDYDSITRQFLHGDGCNRWFDKCFSLIVTKNGLAGLNFEHSWGDGVAILRYMTELYKDSTENPTIHPDTEKSNESPQDFVKSWDVLLDDAAKNVISEAKKNYNNLTNSLNVNIYENKNMGRKFAKTVNISPDYIMQLAFQISQYNMTGKFVGTYESCSTSAFKHGRTETMRPCTLETADICKVLKSSSSLNKNELIKKMLMGSDIHSNLIKEAAMGQGFDRHMFALRLIAEEKGKIPEVYLHPSYKNINHFIISTSSLSSDILLVGCFGPVVSDGYGVGYSIFKERLGCVVTSYSNGANGKGFVNGTSEALEKIHSIFSTS